MTTLEHLLAVRELLAAPERWTQGAWARDASGNPVPSDDKSAVCFCLSAAVERTRPADSQLPDFGLPLGIALAGSAHASLFRAAGNTYLHCYNDAYGRTHAEVLAVIGRAIAAERARPGAQ